MRGKRLLAVLCGSRRAASLCSLLFTLCSFSVFAQQPLYIVNGEERSSTTDIPPEVIDHIEELPADEFTIAQYGEKASNGVVLITLKYDEPPRFCGDTLSLADYVAEHVEWTETDPTARIVLRYRIDTDGTLTVIDQLEATDKRLLRRVLRALEIAPCWEPARKAGTAVESQGVLRLQLPEGRRMPRQVELIWR